VQCGEDFVFVSKEEADQEELFHSEEYEDQDFKNAWQYFDKGFADFMRGDDLEVIFHNLGHSLSSKQVESLVKCVITGRRIHYPKLIKKTRYVYDGVKPKAVNPQPAAAVPAAEGAEIMAEAAEVTAEDQEAEVQAAEDQEANGEAVEGSEATEAKAEGEPEAMEA